MRFVILNLSVFFRHSLGVYICTFICCFVLHPIFHWYQPSDSLIVSLRFYFFLIFFSSICIFGFLLQTLFNWYFNLIIIIVLLRFLIINDLNISVIFIGPMCIILCCNRFFSDKLNIIVVLLLYNKTDYFSKCLRLFF